MDRISLISGILKRDYAFIERDLKRIQNSLDPVAANEDDASIDVRLCIDVQDGDVSWIIRSGDESYDQRHSMLCGASSIQLDSNPQTVLEDLIDQCLDQVAEGE
jgi:hypothetical protein